jgi:hypothetical protein
MTLMTADSDPESLVIDVAAFADAALKMGTRNDGMRAYIAAMRAVPLGPQPVIIDGHQSGTYDPLAKHEAFRAALWGAKHAADGIASELDSLHNWATGGAKELAKTINTPLQRILDLVQGDSVSETQAKEIVTQMTTVWFYTNMLSAGLDTTSLNVTNFIKRMVVDHETLSRGPLELRAVADQVGRSISADAQPYLLNPFTAGIGNVYLAIGRALLSNIDRLAGSIGKALEGHEAMQAGATALGIAMASAKGKYNAAYNAATRSSVADLPTVMRRMRLSTAIASWNQFADFFSRSGL